MNDVGTHVEAPLSKERQKENPAIIRLRQFGGRIFRLTGKFGFTGTGEPIFARRGEGRVAGGRNRCKFPPSLELRLHQMFDMAVAWS
jgi:hypothetical protein